MHRWSGACAWLVTAYSHVTLPQLNPAPLPSKAHLSTAGLARQNTLGTANICVRYILEGVTTGAPVLLHTSSQQQATVRL